MDLLRIIFALSIVILLSDCQNKNESEEIEAITKVIIAEGEARQNNDFELFAECWAHEPYITNYWAINWGCSTIKGWDEMSQWFQKYHQGEPNSYIIRRENINIHINGNIALADFDLFIDNYHGGDLESKANATLERIHDYWRIVYLNVIFDKSFNQ